MDERRTERSGVWRWLRIGAVAGGVLVLAAAVAIGGLLALARRDVEAYWTGPAGVEPELVAFGPSLTRGFWVQYQAGESFGKPYYLWWTARPWRGMIEGWGANTVWREEDWRDGPPEL